ncbi:hypothetical protein [Burkholderia pseudomallei]|uniref:hypothetical protein n=1 Tax=Burkholderia pseudomallei TaxID=28450 RepID=UPI0010099063|nr:hypothetical protein [Burkholderia pseudomallei]
MDRESHDFPSEDLPYTIEKLKRRGIVARLFYGAGLRKLENDYLNPKHGDVLASQRRYRRYLAGDKRVVVEASWAAWSPLILAGITPLLCVLTISAAVAWSVLQPFVMAAKQEISRLLPSQDQPSTTIVSSAGAIIGTPAVGAIGSADRQPRAQASAGMVGSAVSNAAPTAQESAGPAQSSTSATAADNQPSGRAPETEIGQDQAVKLQALLAQAEQQFDAGQYQNAAATTEAILAIEPGNVSARRLHAASLRNLATVTAADAAAAQSVSPTPSGSSAQAAFFPAPTPHHQAIAVYGNSPYGRHGGGR